MNKRQKEEYRTLVVMIIYLVIITTIIYFEVMEVDLTKDNKVLIEDFKSNLKEAWKDQFKEEN